MTKTLLSRRSRISDSRIKSLFIATAVVLLFFTPVVARAATWAAANPGNLLNNSNWSGGVAPNGTDLMANFAATSPTGVGNLTVNGPMTVGTLQYNNAGHRDLTGPGPITFAVSEGNAKYQVRSGGGSGYLDLNVNSVVLGSTTEFSADDHVINVISFCTSVRPLLPIELYRLARVAV